MVRVLILIAISFLFSFTGCKKTDFGSYKEVPSIPDTTSNPYEGYVDGGVLTNNPNGYFNELVGTKWVLTKMTSGLSTTTPNDTLTFTDNTHYSINGGAGSRTYTLSIVTGSTNKSLTLNLFFPFGGSSYSGTVGQTFVIDSQISNVEFDDLQNNSTTIKAWFTKI